ncbi:tetratricopeptide repeat protein [Terriglobus aquaticus]|uniref:Tetratricopeptide repeat protein n=1 Tax=Terriglobus aquaticus TaxID=940139 RepID=A0ABW9KJ98_9BACT|nr:tetratricopeptide repeat protein [Terriglobus aquaticus]
MLRRSLGVLCLAVPLSAAAQWQLPPGTSSSADDSSRQANPTSGANGTIATAEKRMEAQDWSGAIQVLRPLVVREPNNAHAQYDLGFALDNGGDAAGAKAAYEAAAKADPTLVSARVSLGLLLARQGDAAAAARWLREATALPDEAASRPARAQAERALARLDLHSAPEHARDELLAAIRLSSEQRDDIELGGEIAEALQDDAAAEQAYARVLAASPADPDATAAYARVSLREGKIDQADQALQRGLAGHPDNPSLLAGRADLLLRGKKFDEAIPILERLHAADPANEATTLLLARAYVAAGTPDRANELFAALLRTDPKNPTLLVDDADSLIRQKRYAEAAAELERALALQFPTPTAKANAAGRLAFAASASQHPETVLRAVQIRDEILPPDAATTFLLATAHDTLLHTAQAAENYRKFLQLAGSSFPDEVWQAQQRLQVLRRAK